MVRQIAHRKGVQRMHQKVQKIYNRLDADITCEHKITTSENHGVSNSPTVLHNHDGFEIMLFLNESANYYVESEGKKLERGDVICISPYAFHCVELLTPDCYDRIVINIKEPVLKSLSSDKTDLTSCFYHFDNKLNIIHLTEAEIQQLMEYITNLEKNLLYHHFGDDTLANANLIQILVMIHRHTKINNTPKYTSVMPSLVAETFSYIEHHITEDITLQELSRHIHHNADYISRCFKNVTGTSLQQFILAKKVTLAQKYLKEGHSPSDVCYMTGFHNYSNFSRTFTKQIGTSPKKYQLAQKKRV